MKRRFTALISLIICLAVVASLSAIPTLANSAQVHFWGVDATGLVMPDKESPIIVEKEVLTFDIDEFPNNYYYYDNMDEFISYDARVTAEYTFYNPSEYTVTSKLLFPFGNQASYVYGFYDENGEFISIDDTNKYDVKINGVAIEKYVRHTLSDSYSSFELEQDLALISDDFASDDFYKTDLTVTRYTFAVSGVDPKNYQPAHIGLDVKKGQANYRILFPEQNGARRLDNDDMRLYTDVGKNGREFDLYVFGQPLNELPDWKVYENGAVRDNEVIFGTANLVKSETLTFKEFALSNRPEDSAVSESDWYNALIAELKQSARYGQEYPIVECNLFLTGFKSSLMRWYEYEITLSPEQRLVNAVTAPVYPSIDMGYNPTKHEYSYLLSPAKTFKSFGELEIRINTPYYLNSSSLEGFSKVEGGYTLTLNGLPQEELKFTLSESENPVKRYYGGGYSEPDVGGIIVVIGILLAMLLATASGIIALVLVCRKKKDKTEKSDDTTDKPKE